MSTTTAPTRPPMDDHARARAKRAVVAASLGNALEWFDIIVYAFFAVVIRLPSSRGERVLRSIDIDFSGFHGGGICPSVDTRAPQDNPWTLTPPIEAA